MKIKFCGAAKNVTGSSHLIEVNGKKILLDCGLFQGKAEEAQKLNAEFLFDPREIDAMILSHAHIDHCGRIPYLANKGFRGPIYCTRPTVDLCRVMLMDTARLQAQDAEFLKKHLNQDFLPLYNEGDVDRTLLQFNSKDYDKPFEVIPGITATLYEAGHVLGSAQIFLDIKEKDGRRKVLFTGDLGRKYLPILNDPKQIKEADILITESTYASHIHDSFSYVFDELKWAVNDVVARGGKILIPGFSLERTQEVIYVLHKLYLDKQIPELPIFVDSPMSSQISKIFMKYADFYDNESLKDFLGRASSPFAFNKLTYISRKIESQKLNNYNYPCIIIAGSGMCTGGRILHHLLHKASDPRNLILVVGYMAKGTLGRRIVEKKRQLKIFNEYVNLKADVIALNEFSGHADKLELLENIKNIKGLKQIFVVHGEELETSVMRDNIYNILKFKGRVDVPTLGEDFLIHNGQIESVVGEQTEKYWREWQEGRDVESY
jgi:metallo-beta-lactamase family protein